MKTEIYIQLAQQLRGLAKLAASHQPTETNIPKEKLDTRQVFNFIRFFGDKA